MKRCKIALLLVVFGTLPLFCFSQNFGEVSFSYDANGNRILSTLRFRSDDRNETDSESSFLSEVSELFEEMEIKLFPNPTPDRFTMSINGNGAGDAQVLLFSVGGDVLEEKKVGGNAVVFDLSNRPSGLYLVKLTINGKNRAWSVLKQ